MVQGFEDLEARSKEIETSSQIRRDKITEICSIAGTLGGLGYYITTKDSEGTEFINSVANGVIYGTSMGFITGTVYNAIKHINDIFN